MQNISKQYVRSLGLISFNIDSDVVLNKEILEMNLCKSIKNYDDYINKKLMLDGNNESVKKITETIYKKFF